MAVIAPTVEYYRLVDDGTGAGTYKFDTGAPATLLDFGTIDAGTNSNEKQRLRGKGIENPNTGRKGDMFVVIKVIMPTKLDREQKDLINKLSKTNLETSSEFSKIKKYMDKM